MSPHWWSTQASPETSSPSTVPESESRGIEAYAIPRNPSSPAEGYHQAGELERRARRHNRPSPGRAYVSVVTSAAALNTNSPQWREKGSSETEGPSGPDTMGGAIPLSLSSCMYAR